MQVTPSLLPVDPEELATIKARTRREVGWYSAYARFKDGASIIKAYQSGLLMLIEEDDNSIPIFRLRIAGNELNFPPYLLPSSALARLVIGHLWRVKLIEAGINNIGYRLALTSFIRSEERQAQLVAGGKLASPDSTHCVGAAIDIDSSAYYWRSEDGVFMTISDPRRDRQKVISIGSMLGDDPPPSIAPLSFDVRVTEALVSVLNVLHEEGLVNHILEFPGQSNQCSHVAPNPNHDWNKLLDSYKTILD